MDHCNDALAQCSSFFRSAEQKNSSILNFWQKVLAGQKVKVCPQLGGSPLIQSTDRSGEDFQKMLLKLEACGIQLATLMSH